MTRRVLIVDDDPGVRSAIALLLEEEKYDPVEVESAQAALEAIASQDFALVLSDVAMPGMDGIELLAKLRKEVPDLPVVMISAHGDLETAVRAVREGAYDYLVKPIDDERLYHTIAKALELQQLRRDNVALKHEARPEDELLGDSPPMKKLREEIQRAAPSDARILILGENGTGKELVAMRLHELSTRRDRPFIKLNSAAIPRELIESELFGHEPGAFTGAHRMKKGKFELASGGTLFLDEVGDMSEETQSKLLRVLASGEYERVGGSRTLRFDARLITATNRDLLAGGERAFREDLYHRIAVIPVRVPPLRERGFDIDVLADHFLRRFSASQRRQIPTLTERAHELLRSYRWPGNVRELRNLMERIAIMHSSPIVDRSDLEPWLSERAPSATETRTGLAHQWKDEQREADRQRILLTLVESGWNVSRAAERLGIDRASLHRKMKRLGVERPGRQGA